jgi:hydroxymethylbilane synthase
VGAYAAHAPATGTVHLQAGVFDPGGAGAVRAADSGAAAGAAALGRQVAAELLRRGAGDYVSVPGARPSDRGDPQ